VLHNLGLEAIMKVMLRPKVSRPVCLVVSHSCGVQDQSLVTLNSDVLSVAVGITKV
jgi:hypothetical protein